MWFGFIFTARVLKPVKEGWRLCSCVSRSFALWIGKMSLCAQRSLDCANDDATLCKMQAAGVLNSKAQCRIVYQQKGFISWF